MSLTGKGRKVVEHIANYGADAVSEIMPFPAWGFHMPELVNKRRQDDMRDHSKRSKYTDGRIGWRKWAFLAQDTVVRWNFEGEGGERGVY